MSKERKETESQQKPFLNTFSFLLDTRLASPSPFWLDSVRTSSELSHADDTTRWITSSWNKNAPSSSQLQKGDSDYPICANLCFIKALEASNNCSTCHGETLFLRRISTKLGNQITPRYLSSWVCVSHVFSWKTMSLQTEPDAFSITMIGT